MTNEQIIQWCLYNLKQYGFYLLVSITAVFAPINSTIITVFILILSDLILGVYAAMKRGEEITSAGLRRTISKLFVYEMVVLTSFLGETYLLGGILPVVKLVAGVIGITEIKSILENSGDITGLNFKTVIKRLGSKNDK